jgi:ribosomal protein S27E
MHSDNESEFRSQSEREKPVKSVFGLYFCSSCNNMLTPTKANGHLLELNCNICGIKQIDFSNRTN